MRLSRTQRLAGVVALIATLATGASCRTVRLENVPLEKYEPGAGYGSSFAKGRDGGTLRVVLAFSGGGTRAAALAYGVLKELRDTEVEIDGETVRLVDTVTTISSVSGGSFTAAYFGLNGDGIFDDYEDRFLKKDIDARLAANLFLRPIKILRILFTRYTRSDMAIDLYDKQVFSGATFTDLESRNGPLLNINATDIGVGTIFTFIQPDMDMICADLSKMRIAQAVTASSAVPGIFAPLVMKNYAGTCGYPEAPWIKHALANPTESRRLYHAARSASTYLDSDKRPYIFLVDGGVADNIGARRIMADVMASGGEANLMAEGIGEYPERVIYIIVNAQVGGHHSWAQSAEVPSFRAVLSSVSGTGIYRYNFETIELFRESVATWSVAAAQQGHPMRAFVAEVAFDNLADSKERDYFNGVGTNFNLSDEKVDRLIEVGGRLLRETPDFKKFLESVK